MAPNHQKAADAVNLASSVVEDEGPQLDALARQHIGRTSRVLKGGMGGKARPAVLGRIVAFDQDRFVGPHLGRGGLCSMSDNRKEAGGSPSLGEQRQEREGEPGDTVPFGPERHGAASELWAHEQGRQAAYLASLSANDMQARRATAAALAGASNVIVPPQQPPENLRPVLLSGVVVPQSISVVQGQTVATIRTPIPDWSAVGAEMLARLESIEAGFQKIAPFEVAYGERGQLVHNYPPERIEMLPLDTIEIQMGTEVAKLARAELNTENPRRDVLRVSGLVLNQIAARTSACLSWIGAKGDKFVDAFVTSAGTETGKRLVQGVAGVVGVAAATAILHELHVDLTAIVNQILHLVTP